MLIELAARFVRHSRYDVFQLAEMAGAAGALLRPVVETISRFQVNPLYLHPACPLRAC
jgi:hypothetical protein